MLISVTINAQLTDLARLEYSFIPKTKSEDRYTRIKAAFNYPIQIKKDNYFLVGLEYNRLFIELEDQYPFDPSLLNKATILDLNFVYTYKINKKWRTAFKVTPRISSTLSKKITGDDLFLNGAIFFIKNRTNDDEVTKPYRLILGLTYNTTTGIPFPLPFINYNRKVNEKWSYTLGVPKMNLKYNINKKNSLQSFAGLDGYFANLQEPILINNKQANSISLSVLVAGLGYEHQFTKHLFLYTYSGFTFRLNNVLRDSNRDNLLTLDNLNAFYLRTGIKFKI